MIFKYLYAVLTAVAFLLACPQRALAADPRTTAAGSFSAVQVAGALPVELRQVPDSAGIVIISASERALPFVKVSNTDGTLCIHFDGHGRDLPLASEVRAIRAYYGHDMRQLLLTGSCRVVAAGMHTSDDLTVVVTGGGSLTLDRIDCRNFTASLTGSGHIGLNGLRTRNAGTSVAGSGSLSAAGIDATAFNCTISGSGSASVEGHVADASLALRGSGQLNASSLMAGALDISVTGSGTVSYNRVAKEVKIISGHDNGGTVTYRQ